MTTTVATTLATVSLALSGVANAQDSDALIREAIALHDQALYAEAIAIYEQILEADPDNSLAAYEMAFSYQASGDLASCVDSADMALSRATANAAADQHHYPLYTVLASCHSASGNVEDALRVFRDGLERFPDSYDLHFNIGITLGNTGDLESALHHFSRAQQLDRAYPSPYFMLAEILSRLNRHSEAMLAYAAFLQLEFNTERCQLAAVALINSMYAPRSDDDAPVLVVSDADDLKSGAVGLQLAYYAAKITRTEDDEIAEPLADNFANAIQAYFRLASAVALEDDDESLVSDLLPVTARVADAAVVEPFAWFIVDTAGVPGAGEWLDGNRDKVDELVDFLRAIERSGR